MRHGNMLGAWLVAVLGVPAAAQGSDCNHNGVLDSDDIANGTSLDCNGNGTPDECEIFASTLIDDFDGGGPPPGVTRGVGGFWSITDCCDPPAGVCDPTGQFAYYGRCTVPFPPFTCTLAGTMTSQLSYAQLQIPANPVDANLSFCYALLSSGDTHERPTVRVNGAIVDDLHTELTDPWAPKVVDLATYAGQIVLLSFHFVHDGIGTLRGWHVDDIRLGNPDGTQADCNGNGLLDECDIAADPSLDLDGDGTIDSCQCQVSSHCSSAPNSVGPGATIRHLGTTSVSANAFTLRAEGAPPSQPGLFFYGPLEIQVPFGNGFRCVGGGATGIFRLYPSLAIGPNGALDRQLDFTLPPAVSGPGEIDPGSTWSFQFWYRDPAAGGAAFNLSNGLTATFCP